VCFVLVREQRVIPETINQDASLFSHASQERLAELEEKEQAEGGSTEASQQEKAKLRRSISRSALKRSNTERCQKTPFGVVFASKIRQFTNTGSGQAQDKLEETAFPQDD
jgi:hypothetical protein